MHHLLTRGFRWRVSACHEFAEEEIIPDDINAHVDGALHAPGIRSIGYLGVNLQAGTDGRIPEA